MSDPIVTTKKEREEWKQIESAATPILWWQLDSRIVCGPDGAHAIGGLKRTEDSKFIICARNNFRRLIADVEQLTESHERLHAMIPLFQEARDALSAIPLTAAKLRGLDLTLADRMDDVGIPERWKARKERGG